MSEQIFISYRRVGADVSAKLICEALKNRGFSVFYDFDSLHGGYFDTRIISAIEACDDFVLVLPPQGLDRCVNDDDWVREEIRTALKNRKNIVPVMLADFAFPKELPSDIAEISRINGVPFSMPFFDAMIDTIVDRLRSTPDFSLREEKNVDVESSDLEKFRFDPNKSGGYSITYLSNNDERIVIPAEYNGKPITEIADNGFKGAKRIKEIKMPNSILRIGAQAFEECSALNSIALSKSLTEIGDDAFLECSALETITLPQSVTSVGCRAFSGCAALVSAKIASRITNIPEGMFDGCRVLREIIIPSSVISIGESAFKACSKLETVVIPNSVTSIGAHAFAWCAALTEIDLPNGLTKISDSMFRSSGLTQLKVPESVSEVERYAFYRCKALKFTVFTDSVTKLGECAFCECTSLTTAILGDDISEIGFSTFEGCSALRTITLPKNLKKIGSKAFSKCHQFLKIDYFGGKEGWKSMSKAVGALPLFTQVKIY